jgi:hypothetical protein
MRLIKQQIKQRNIQEIEDIYAMFDQTIDVVVRNSKIKIK